MTDRAPTGELERLFEECEVAAARHRVAEHYNDADVDGRRTAKEASRSMLLAALREADRRPNQDASQRERIARDEVVIRLERAERQAQEDGYKERIAELERTVESADRVASEALRLNLVLTEQLTEARKKAQYWRNATAQMCGTDPSLAQLPWEASLPTSGDLDRASVALPHASVEEVMKHDDGCWALGKWIGPTDNAMGHWFFGTCDCTREARIREALSRSALSRLVGAQTPQEPTLTEEKPPCTK